METFFTFDNTNIGDITRRIKNYYFDDDNKLYKVDLEDDICLNVCEYKNDFVFVINETKSLFNICKTKYNLVFIKGKIYLVYKNLNNISLKEYKKSRYLENNDILLSLVQKNFVFNWLMCVKGNYENKIQGFPVSFNYKISDTKNSDFVRFLTINENNFNYNTNDVKISALIIKEYFENSNELFDNVAKKFANSIDPDLLRRELLKIVNKYDNNYVSWVNCVYQNFLNLKD